MRAHHTPANKYLKIAAHLSRMSMGLIFIVSGFVKAIDPWGTMIKVSEYLSIYGWESLIPMSLLFSIWMCGAELMMGMMLTFKVRIRLVSIFAMISMSIFTVVAYLSATVLPVEDCGCFGDALKLTPWQTFTKNILILPMAFTVYWRYRPDKIFLFKRVEAMLATIFFFIAMGIPTYCLLHLPLIDLLPYRVGVNLPEAIAEARVVRPSDIEVELVYRNIKSGRLRTFDLDDKAWHDDSKWEWVETRTIDLLNEVKPLVGEFSLRDVGGADVTSSVLATTGVLNLLFMESLSGMSEKCRERMERFIEEANERGERTVCVTPDFIDPNGEFMGVECLNIDPTTMKTALRARYGLISLNNGVISRKLNCRDI